MPTWSNLALWMLVVTSAIAVVRLVRQRVPCRGWLVVLGSVMALAIAGRLLLRPGWIAVALGVWFLLVWLPSVLLMFSRQLTLRERYGPAAILARAASLLHPCDGWWQTPRYLDAFRQARSGDLDGATRTLEALASARSPYADRARVHLGRLSQRWDEVVAWSRERPEQWQRDAELFAMVLRAHGEIGDTAGMVDLFERHRSGGHRSAPQVRDAERLSLFAFAGDVEGVRRVLDRGFAALPRIAHDFWVATARLYAGEREAARAEFERLLATAPDPWPRALRRRLAQTEAPHAPLDEVRAAIVAREGAACEADSRYGGATSLFGPAALVTRLLIVANLAAFALEVWEGGSTDLDTLLGLGALATDRVLAGEWWRLVAATFLHYGPIHLAMNLAALSALGPAAERQLGRLRFLLVYLLAGIGATAMCTIWAMLTGSRLFVVGASGSVMGIVGASAAIMLRGWLRERAPAARRRGAAMAGYVIAQMVIDSMVPAFSFTSHLTGALVGFTVALLLGDSLGPGAADADGRPGRVKGGF